MRRSQAPLLVALCLTVGSSIATAAITKDPFLQNPGMTTMTVMWESDTGGEGAVLFGPDAPSRELPDSGDAIRTFGLITCLPYGRLRPWRD